MKKLILLSFCIGAALLSCSKDDVESEQYQTQCYFESLRKANGSPEITFGADNGRNYKQIEYLMQTDTLQYHCEQSKVFSYAVGENANEYFAKFLSQFSDKRYIVDMTEYGKPEFKYKVYIINSNNQSKFGDIIDLNFGRIINAENVSVKVRCFH